MKISILNGSPRLKGNTSTIVEQLSNGIDQNKHEVSSINVTKKKVAGCTACLYCRDHNGQCVHKDDTNEMLETLLDSDLIIFASPVYWWGISAQLKQVVDKFYANMEGMKNKKYGIVSVGGANLNNIQYELISKQFQSIAGFLSWENILDESESAHDENDIRNNEKTMEKYLTIGQNI